MFRKLIIFVIVLATLTIMASEAGGRTLVVVEPPREDIDDGIVRIPTNTVTQAPVIQPQLKYVEVGLTVDREANRELARTLFADTGWTDWAALDTLVFKESGWNNAAQNRTSTTYGQFQFLDSTWAGTGFSKTSDPGIQILAGFKYIKNRYGTPTNALLFHRANGYY